MAKENNNQELKPRNRDLVGRVLRRYLGFVNNNIYWRKIYVEGRDNMPADGTPTVLVQNHQNCLIDPLSLVFILSDRMPRYLARASVFKNPILGKAIRWLGALPTYRMKVDGLSSVAKNKGTLDEVANSLRHGETVVLYPEGQHQNKRWLGAFSQAYLKMAFGAAEESGFEREIFVMPSAHHYSNYLGVRADMMVMFAKPISLKPYYELYKEQPRQAMRQVNDLVRGEIERMMLNITDLDNYAEIDFIRTSTYGDHFAVANGYDPALLPQKLASDKNLVAALDAARIDNPTEVEQVFDLAKELRKGVAKLNISEHQLAKAPTSGALVLHWLLLLLGLPVALFGLGPTLLVFLVPMLVNKLAIKDKQFWGSINLGTLLLVTYPLCGIVPSIVMLCGGHLLSALGYLLVFSLAIPFVWHYANDLLRTLHYTCASRKKSRLTALRTLRNDLASRLDKLLGVK